MIEPSRNGVLTPMAGRSSAIGAGMTATRHDSRFRDFFGIVPQRANVTSASRKQRRPPHRAASALTGRPELAGYERGDRRRMHDTPDSTRILCALRNGVAERAIGAGDAPGAASARHSVAVFSVQKRQNG